MKAIQTREVDYTFEWTPDEDVDSSWMDSKLLFAYEAGEFKCLQLLLYIDGEPADSLGSILVTATGTKRFSEMRQFERDMLEANDLKKKRANPPKK